MSSKTSSKKVLVIGDLHCGSMSGLTHPDYMTSAGRSPFFHDLQQEMWEKYLATLDKFGHIDVLVVNGDAIDGKGSRVGGSELIASDMNDQCDMAVAALSEIDADCIAFTYGTPYHTQTSSGEDMERVIADAFNAEISAQMNIRVDGVLFNIRHTTGSSGNPASRGMSVGRERMWDVIKSSEDGDEHADVYIRSHVHYFSMCGGPGWRGYTLPALQSSYTRFGTRMCVGQTHWGMCLFHVENGRMTWCQEEIVPLETLKRDIYRI